MAKVDWSWKPQGMKPRKSTQIQAPRANPPPLRNPGVLPMCTPASTSKSVRAETIIGGWGKGLGNHVCQVANGVNAEQIRVAALMDADGKPEERQASYAKLRESDAYKLERAKRKRARQKRRAYNGVQYKPATL
jgi:hypothetical protein